MEKKSFREVYEKIEVPKDGVLNAIRAGKERAGHNEPKNTKSPNKVVWFSVAAATIFISSSFISPSISHVMAEVPLLGNVYTAFNDAVGRDLQSQDLITELNQTSNYKGVDVFITNAYYDGAVVGVTFTVKGNVRTEEDGSVQGFYEIFDGKGGISDSKELVYMEPSVNGYIGHIQLSYPKTELPSETSFPLEFKRIGGKEGSWRFDVPINQIPYETVNVDKGTNDENAEVNVHFDSIIQGKASTAINYTATFPIEGKHDQVRLETYDDQGKEIAISIDGIDLETVKENNRIIVKGRSIIPQSVKGETSYIEVLPKVALSEPYHYIKLDEATPVEVNAERQDLAVGIENIIKTDKSVTFDFQINNGNYINQVFSFFSNFAHNDITLVKESEKDIYEKPIKHSVEVINKDKLRFTSKFDISEIDDFNLNDYVIRVNMGSLSANIPVELEKIKIDIN
ncbi:DUF4179 domain-containing protein [Psychrobacillus sp. NEAU-3TGS]|uniref:DUF4179 domain-containing protein n=1 Tax=Psychrobacillus sp. NEAU-3TGS TaxID=2995412 RepID=UPI002497C216|nr:DUF4179 domain-containing protein [Psychrobacillus sp. NEAU-3TGS]MDI2588541.1 DUF4179 domain-containing protein [Psychrobacillus sp. NEAU-3TGS]